jgi:hypothetical protein
VQRQAGKYDASDLEDRYQLRLRALIDATAQGRREPQVATSNVVDLMATLKKSLGQAPEEKPERAPSAQEGGAKTASGSRSGSEQAFTQAGLIILFLPGMEANEAVVLLKAHHAVDLGLVDRPDLVIAHAAFWALKPEH